MMEWERQAGRREDDASEQATGQESTSPLPRSTPATQNATDDLEFQRQMELARQVMRDHRNVLRELSK